MKPTLSEMMANKVLDGRNPPSSVMGVRDCYPWLHKNGFLGTSTKIKAGESVGVLGAVMYMMPARTSGKEACSGRSPGCTDACLAEHTGRMSMTQSRRARRRRHAAFYADREQFLTDLSEEILAHYKRALKKDMVPAVRLNGTTDLPWHRMRFGEHKATIHELNPKVLFYEYTKLPLGITSKGGLPENLSFTFSVNERPDSDERAAEYLAAGYNAAVVMRIKKHQIPATFRLNSEIWPVVDGDEHDARFLDPPGHIVALSAKGLAKTDTSGFVREAN